MSQPIDPTDSIADGTDLGLPVIEPIAFGEEPKAYKIHGPQKILALLRDWTEGTEPVTVYPAGSGAFLCGRLVQVAEPGRRFVVQAEPGAVPPPGLALVVAAPGSQRVQFQAQFDWRQRPDGMLEGTAELPAAMVHSQRRRFTRVETPLGPSLRAQFIARGKKRVMSVDDLSLGGVGLRGAQRDHSDLVANQRLERVRLELGASVLLDIRLDICSRRAYRSFLAGDQLHFGCRFVDLHDKARATLERVLLSLEEDRPLDTAF